MSWFQKSNLKNHNEDKWKTLFVDNILLATSLPRNVPQFITQIMYQRD